jgi:DNA primase
VLAFDMDVAGDSATKRGINGAQEQGFNIKIIEHYGEGDKKSDPAEIIAKDSKIWEESLTKAKSIMDYYVDSALSHFDKSTPEGKKEISKIVLPAIQRLNNKIEQSYWVQKLSQVLGIREEAIVDELAKVKVTRQPTEAAKEIPPTINDAKLSPQARRKLIEEKMVSLLLKNPDFITLIEQAHLYLFSDHIKKFLEEVKKYAEKKGASDGKLQEDFKAVFSANNDALDLDAELKNFLAALTLRADVEYENDGEEEFLLCLLQLKNIELKNALTRLSEDMRSAEEKKDQTKVAQLMEQFNQLSKELK